MMGRLDKTGLDYFPVDTEWETNMKLIKARFKLAGVGCVIELWKAVYHEGYALKWDEDTQLLFADENGIDLEWLQKIVVFAAEKGVFSADILAGKGVLTSRGIQKRWRSIAVASKRKNSSIDPEVCLIEVSTGNTPEETTNTPEETAVSPRESAQSKGKERRGVTPQGGYSESSSPETESRPPVGAHEAPPSGQPERQKSARQVQASSPVPPSDVFDAQVAAGKAQLSGTSAKAFIEAAVAEKRQGAKTPPVPKVIDDFDPRAPDDFDPVVVETREGA